MSCNNSYRWEMICGGSANYKHMLLPPAPIRQRLAANGNESGTLIIKRSETMQNSD